MSVKHSENKENNTLYILPTKDLIVFPQVILPLVVENQRMVEMINRALINRLDVGVFAELGLEANESHIYKVGTRASILKMIQMPDNSTRLLIQGRERVRITKIVQEQPFIAAEVRVLKSTIKNEDFCEAQVRAIKAVLDKIANKSPLIPEDLISQLSEQKNIENFTDLLAANLELTMPESQVLLEENVLDKKLEMLLNILNREAKIVEITGDIQNKVNNEVDKNQREFILREQLKAIKEELGEDEEEDEWEAEVEDIRKQIKKAKMPKEIEKVAMKELERLAEMPPVAAEYTISRTYIDWLVALPWGKETKDNMDIANAIRILDEDHYDLKDVKDRILEFLAVHKLRKQTKGPILCFAGPPGVGKTSLGKSIARAMGRKFVRYSVGGIHDEAEIRGHRRTYIGALPGRIIQMIKEAGTRNPVFMLDEIDKLGTDFRGDPASALLEALDPQQNIDFVDHYLDVKFDLSRVMFITTCNVLYNIPPALLDRMEVIEIPGYISEEKVQIARKYLVPRQIEENGLKKSYLKFNIDAIERIILDYTHEAGVRNLEREIANICRKVARRFAEGDRTPVTIGAENVPKYLGPPKNFPELAGIKDEIGIATGLAWTPVGGEILFIESTAMKGGKHLTLTGQLGEVMRESAQAALSYIRTHAEEYHIDPDFFKNNDIHIHVPSGAVAKDGPSAGVTIATSLLSLLTRQPVRHDVAMTGEITLRGRILPVGGIKEKVLAAKRSGISTVVLPKRNEKDLIQVPENIRKKMKFVFVEKLGEAFAFALRGTSGAVPKNKRTVKRKTVTRAGERAVTKVEHGA